LFLRPVEAGLPVDLVLNPFEYEPG